MSPIAYSPKKDDLFFPCKNAQFFAGGPPATDALLCAEMARLAYCRIAGNNFALDRNKITGVLATVGFSPVGFFESQGNPDGEGTHCFVALRNDRQVAVVAFRGTDASDPTDVADDIDALPVPWGPGGKVHQGFKGALADVQADVLKALAPLNARLLFTGHSLGAALATLLATLKPPASLYTIGSPLVGDADFVATLAAVENHRYVDCCDIVTRAPPEEFGYRHLGKPYYIAKDRTMHFDASSTFIFADRLVAAAEYPFAFQAWKKENVGVRELADHAPVNYVSAIAG